MTTTKEPPLCRARGGSEIGKAATDALRRTFHGAWIGQWNNLADTTWG
jgi:hypothetical protein